MLMATAARSHTMHMLAAQSVPMQLLPGHAYWITHIHTQEKISRLN